MNYVLHIHYLTVIPCEAFELHSYIICFETTQVSFHCDNYAYIYTVQVIFSIYIIFVIIKQIIIILNIEMAP